MKIHADKPAVFDHTHAPVLDMDEYFFTSKKEAITEIIKRRKNPHLSTLLAHNEQLTAFVKAAHLSKPVAVLFRQLATPTHEVIRFLRTAKQLNLTPLLFEYHGDKFVGAGNTYKRSLGKMPIYQYTGTDGRDMVKYHKVFDFNVNSGKRLLSIVCLNGENLIEFHHRLLARVAKIRMTYCFDATSWLTKNGGLAPHYYESFLTLFLRNAVLFESFEETPPVRKFFNETVLPAFHNVESRYGVRPLVVRLLPPNGELRLFWDSYPRKVEKFL